jgi:type VI protein secretion system component VasF
MTENFSRDEFEAFKQGDWEKFNAAQRKRRSRRLGLKMIWWAVLIFLTLATMPMMKDMSSSTQQLLDQIQALQQQ